MTTTTLTYPSMAEARAAMIREGYVTVENGILSCIMTKTVNGRKVAEAIINREGFLEFSIEILEC